MLSRLNLLAAFVLLLVFFVSIPASRAQVPVDPPAAPLPTQILTAKRVFISNVSGDFPVPFADLAYNEFYSGMKNWGRFELVGAPSDADLVFEIRFAYWVDPTSPYFSLRILDAKTHFALWALSRDIRYSANGTKNRRNFDQAMTAFLEDVKKLAAPRAASDAATKN